ncbi:MAG TPA: hypothetical protein VGA95_06585 [Thermodesulfobacteriota bacterium]
MTGKLTKTIPKIAGKEKYKVKSSVSQKMSVIRNLFEKLGFLVVLFCIMDRAS